MAKGKVLIVDDDVDIVEAMKVVLSSKGYQVSSAQDSSVAQACLEKDLPDVIILDVMMRSPQEGFGFARWLHQHDTFKTIPVLMLSGVKGETGIDFKSEAGDEAWLPVAAFLDKPVKPDVLVEKVASLIKSS
ncbi:MAG: response regulator [Phycisphaerae bacterium]|nr:response regulator [Phycisphaerae bacterium]